MYKNNNYNDVYLYKIIRPILKGFMFLTFRPKIIGKENINEEGRLILAGNHTSIFDSLLLISCTKREIHFLAKKELWKGFKKIIFSNLGLIPVDRKNKDHNALESAINYLNNDKVIGIFPEGTTEKKKGILLPFKIGAVKMARDTNSKIIPFVITGQYKVFSNNLTIRFGKSFYIETDNLEDENNMLKDKIRLLIKEDF